MSDLHDEWLKAKQRRDNAAFMIAKAFAFGTLDRLGPRELEKFKSAEAEMERLEKDMDGRGER